MLVLNNGIASEKIIVTLNEKRTLDSGYYLFVFENISTRATVKKVFSFSEDESHYTTRYNKFSISTASLFGDSDHGQWTYTVYESATNTENTSGLSVVEYGLMKLNPVTEFAFETYQPVTSYKQYNG